MRRAHTEGRWRILAGLLGLVVAASGCKSLGTADQSSGDEDSWLLDGGLIVQSRPLTGKVIGHSDGDTIDVAVEGSRERTRVRLSNIDTPEKARRRTPELGQDPWATEASDQMKALAPLGTTVVLRPVGGMSFRRMIAAVAIDGQDLGISMVRTGWALPLIFCRPSTNCAKANLTSMGAQALIEACVEAENAGLGVFSRERPLPELPYEFRDRAWGMREIVWVADYATERFYDFDKRNEVPACRQIVFALEDTNGRAEGMPPDSTRGSPVGSGYTRPQL